jgi:hypothetical protein
MADFPVLSLKSPQTTHFIENIKDRIGKQNQQIYQQEYQRKLHLSPP